MAGKQVLVFSQTLNSYHQSKYLVLHLHTSLLTLPKDPFYPLKYSATGLSQGGNHPLPETKTTMLSESVKQTFPEH